MIDYSKSRKLPQKRPLKFKQKTELDEFIATESISISNHCVCHLRNWKEKGEHFDMTNIAKKPLR